MASTELPPSVGPFTVLATLGRGGMASVYQATDSSGRVVALKVMDPNLGADPAFVLRFLREARISSMLDHPRVVRVHSFGEADGLHYLASELVAGGTLARIVKRGQRVPGPVAAEFIGQLLEGLAHAHDKGVVHRDLKPANLLLTPEGQLKIADFGIARAGDDTNLTQTGAVTGTARYMSPEQVLGKELDARSDLFTTGVIFYELLTGVPPTGEGSAETLMARLMAKQSRPLLEVNPLIPASMVRVVEQLLAWDVADRFASAAKALEALAPLRQGPELATEYVQHTDALLARLRRSEALRLLRRATEALAQQPPVLESAALNLSLCLELEPDLGEARALQAELGPRVNFTTGRSQNPRVVELEARLADSPHDSQVLAQLTQLYRTEGNFLRAAQCMRRYVVLRPDDTYMEKQLARLAGDDWVPTQVIRKPQALRDGPTATRPRPTGPTPQRAAAPEQVVVYADAPTTASTGPWLKWAIFAVVVGVIGLGVRAGIRSLEHSQQVRVKQLDLDAQKQAATLMQLQLQQLGPAVSYEAPDAGP